MKCYALRLIFLLCVVFSLKASDYNSYLNRSLNNTVKDFCSDYHRQTPGLSPHGALPLKKMSFFSIENRDVYANNVFRLGSCNRQDFSYFAENFLHYFKKPDDWSYEYIEKEAAWNFQEKGIKYIFKLRELEKEIIESNRLQLNRIIRMRATRAFDTGKKGLSYMALRVFTKHVYENKIQGGLKAAKKRVDEALKE